MKKSMLLLLLLLGGCAVLSNIKEKYEDSLVTDYYCGEGNGVDNSQGIGDSVLILCKNGDTHIVNKSNLIYMKYWQKVTKLLDYLN